MRKTGRKLAAFSLAAVMVMSMAACGKKTEAPVDTTAATTAGETTTAAETEAPDSENQQAAIVVIGAGGAGMTAAIQALSLIHI